MVEHEEDHNPSLGEIVQGLIHDTPEIKKTAELVGVYTLANLAFGRVPELYELGIVSYIANVIADPWAEAFHPWLVAPAEEKAEALEKYIEKFHHAPLYTVTTEFILEAGLTALTTWGLLVSGLPILEKVYQAGYTLFNNGGMTAMEGASHAAIYTLGIAGITLAAGLFVEGVVSPGLKYLGKGLYELGKAMHKGKYHSG